MPTSAPPPTDVPPDAEAARCPYCDQPFRTDRLRTLHVGEAHDPTEAERERYDEATEAEREELFMLHLRVWFALAGAYAAFIIASIVAFS